MTFVEALEYAMSRKIILPEDYYHKISDMQRHSATSIAGISKLEHIDFIISKAHKSILDGSTFAEFANTIKNSDLDINLSEARLKLIFRTNVQSAYNHGKWQQQTRNRKYRPWLMYHAVKDNRTRDEHYRLNQVIKHIDDPFWTIYYPLNGYNCRCSVRSLTERQMLKMGGETIDLLDSYQIDMSEGFKTGPMFHDKTLQSLVEQYKSSVVLDMKSRDAFDMVKNSVLNQGTNASIKVKSDAIKFWLDVKNQSLLTKEFEGEFKQVAKKYNLDEDEFKILRGYTKNYDKDFNDFLSGDFSKVDDSSAKNLMMIRSLLNDAAKKLPTYTGTLTKGLTLTSVQLGQYKVGSEVTINSFFNILEDNINISSENNVLLTIKSKNGKIIDEISGSKTKEILLLSPSNFIIASKTKVDDKIQIVLIEV